jgi:hypothetical protein
MKEHDGHEDLHSLGHQRVIPYVHRRICVSLYCCVLNLPERV